jgi:hypothetical protein
MLLEEPVSSLDSGPASSSVFGGASLVVSDSPSVAFRGDPAISLEVPSLNLDPSVAFHGDPAISLEVPSLNLDPGLASSDFLGTSLAVSPNLLVVSPNLSARSLVASDRFSGGTTVPISLSDRVSLPLIHAPLNAAVSSSSLVTSSSTDMALAISVIEESRASDTVVSSLLDDSTLGSSASSASTPALSCHDWPPLSSPIKWGLPNPPPHPDEGLGWSNTSHRCAIAAAYCDLPKSSRCSVDCCVRQHRLGVSRVRPWGAFSPGRRASVIASVYNFD